MIRYPNGSKCAFVVLYALRITIKLNELSNQLGFMAQNAGEARYNTE